MARSCSGCAARTIGDVPGVDPEGLGSALQRAVRPAALVVENWRRARLEGVEADRPERPAVVDGVADVDRGQVGALQIRTTEVGASQRRLLVAHVAGIGTAQVDAV